jgi:hypothetical protein
MRPEDEARSSAVRLVYRLVGSDIDLALSREIDNGLASLDRLARINSGRSPGELVLDTSILSSSEDLLEHYSILIAALLALRSTIESARSREGTTSTIVIWWVPKDGPIGFNFPSRELRLLSDFCDTIEFCLD